jgi:membrane protein insertase Oxa1/YidC/SpoIIIJ
MGCYYPDELSTGGILWFVDLTREDPLHLLPILSGTASLLVFEVGADFGQNSNSNMTPRRKLFGRGVALAFIPLFMFSPASVHIFWTSNWLLSALQDVLISQPAVQNKLGIQRTSGELTTTPIVFIKDVTNEKENQQQDGEESLADTTTIVVVNRKMNKGSRNKNKKRR